jgi:hypothetical protein
MIFYKNGCVAPSSANGFHKLWQMQAHEQCLPRWLRKERVEEAKPQKRKD